MWGLQSIQSKHILKIKDDELLQYFPWWLHLHKKLMLESWYMFILWHETEVNLEYT
jgi:hypothetical protein